MTEISKDGNPYTEIKVTQFEPFFVIEGRTSSKKIIDLDLVKERFFEEMKPMLSQLGIKNVNTIDLIKYNVDGISDEKKEFCSEFFHSTRPVFHERVLNYVYNHSDVWEAVDYTDKLLVYTNEYIEKPLDYSFKDIRGSRQSEFPYGYSLNNGRSAFCYCEYIANQLFPSIKATNMSIKYTDIIDEETNDPIIEIISNSPYLNSKIKSMVLDVFDFNISRFEIKYLKNYDLMNDLDTQLENKPWLVKDKISELYII
jgi:hypothetical protein